PAQVLLKAAAPPRRPGPPSLARRRTSRDPDTARPGTCHPGLAAARPATPGPGCSTAWAAPPSPPRCTRSGRCWPTAASPPCRDRWLHPLADVVAYAAKGLTMRLGLVSPGSCDDKLRWLASLASGDLAVAATFDLSYRDLPTSRQRLFRRLG